MAARLPIVGIEARPLRRVALICFVPPAYLILVVLLIWCSGVAFVCAVIDCGCLIAEHWCGSWREVGKATAEVWRK